MHKITEITSRLQSTTTTQIGNSGITEERDFINHIFADLCSIFTKWREIWTSADEVKSAKQQWLRTLKEQGIHSDLIVQAGLKRCRASGYVRPIPAGQFCEWAIEEFLAQNNIPSRKALFKIVLNRICLPGDKVAGYVPSPPELWIYRQNRWPQLKTEINDNVRGLFDELYDDLIEFVLSGNALPVFQQPTAFIEHDTEDNIQKEHCEKNYSRDQMLKKIAGAGGDMFAMMTRGEL